MSTAAGIARKFAIGLGIIPHILLALALLNLIVMRIIEGPPPATGGGVNIGLAFLILAAMLNVPSAICWLIYVLLHATAPTRSA
jgi:hypothetical protein